MDNSDTGVDVKSVPSDNHDNHDLNPHVSCTAEDRVLLAVMKPESLFAVLLARA